MEGCPRNSTADGGRRLRRRKWQPSLKPRRAKSQTSELRLPKPGISKRLSCGSSGSSTTATLVSEEENNRKETKAKKRPRRKKPEGVKISSRHYLCFDKGVQRYYFYNVKASKSTWKLSRKEESVKFILSGKSIGEVHEWQIFFDYKLKRYYFYNHDLSTTHWVLPIHYHQAFSIDKEKAGTMRKRATLKTRISAEDVATFMRQSLREDEDDRCSKAKGSAPLMKPIYLTNNGDTRNRSQSEDFADLFADSDEEIVQPLHLEEREMKFRATIKGLTAVDSTSILQTIMTQSAKYSNYKGSSAQSDDESSWTVSDEEES